jgi:Aerotolerance regulator N-terminal
MTLTLGLLAPLGLAALAALALPIAIHLVRRIELRTTEFAALRWIAERVRPRRRLRFERPWLLLLRLAVIALFALLIARPFIGEPVASKPAWVLVAPGSNAAAARASVSIADADWRWLAPGFPPIESSIATASVPTASLLREIDAELPRDTKLSVVVPQEIDGLDGERPLLSREVDWHVVPGKMPRRAAAPRDGKVEIAVRYAPSAEPALRYLSAAIAALDVREPGRYAIDAQPLGTPIDSTIHDLVWLGAEVPAEVKAWIEAGGTALVSDPKRTSGATVWRDADGRALARAEPLGRGRLIALQSAFSPESLPAILDADFPDRLRGLIEGEPAPPTRAPADAARPVPATSHMAASATSSSTRPLDPWLALAIALLVLVERIVATRTREPA